MQLDLGDSVSIQNFSSDIMAQFSKVDCIICNAGVLVPSVPNDIFEDEVDSYTEGENQETATWYPAMDEESRRNINANG